MTHKAQPLSENGRLIGFCLLFPLLWPFLPILLICLGIEKLRDAYYAWKFRKPQD